ncbi:hypothetical protein OUZ56_006231 [Daphnia magna]|uniref:Uncharacterized protein n=1 Tax=Daphnia magna TaxID=35525 RepID=A0ABQ9YV10_9CRUS|nr:hypothetical protein OUZ56_006231 [Daphnia magna]
MELENILDNSYFHHLNYFSQITLDTRGTNSSSSSSHGEWSTVWIEKFLVHVLFFFQYNKSVFPKTKGIKENRS